MPNFFGEDCGGAFAETPEADRERIRGQLRDRDPEAPGRQTILDNGPGQIRAIVSFLYAAGEQKLNKVQPVTLGERRGKTKEAQEASVMARAAVMNRRSSVP
jgi:hypothetical protein